MVSILARSLCAIALAAAVAGCYTEHFNYVESTHGNFDVFHCHILSPYGTVERDGDSIVIHPNGIVTARKPGVTFTQTEFYVRVARGDAARMRFRSVDFGTSVYPGIEMVLGVDTSYVQLPGGVRRPIGARASAVPTRVTYFSEGAVSQIVVGCDTVFADRTTLPATDVMVFESVNGSEVVVRGMESRTLRRHEGDFRPKPADDPTGY